MLLIDTEISMHILERFGLPVALLAVLLYAMMRAARWSAPRVDKLIERHERLLDTLESELRTHGALLTKMEENQDYVLKCLRGINKRLDSMEDPPS